MIKGIEIEEIAMKVEEAENLLKIFDEFLSDEANLDGDSIELKLVSATCFFRRLKHHRSLIDVSADILDGIVKEIKDLLYSDDCEALQNG